MRAQSATCRSEEQRGHARGQLLRRGRHRKSGGKARYLCLRRGSTVLGLLQAIARLRNGLDDVETSALNALALDSSVANTVTAI